MALTRATLRGLVRTYIDNTDTNASDAFSDAQINAALFEAAGELQTFIEQADQNFFEADVSANLTGNELSITLPTDFRQLNDLRRTDNNANTKFRIVDRRLVGSNDLNILNNNNYDKYDFYLTGNTIKFFMAMGEAWTYTLSYNKDIAEPADGATYGLPRAAEHVLPYIAATLLLGSEGSKSDFWERKISMGKADLLKSISRRNNTGPRYVASPYGGT